MKSLGRRLLKGLGIVAALMLLAIIAIVAINATDEDLSEEARAMLKYFEPPAAVEGNAFVDLQKLPLPARGSPSLNSPSREKECLALMAESTALREELERDRGFLQSYRAATAKPAFVDLRLIPGMDRNADNPGDLAISAIHAGERLALMDAAMRFNAGDTDGAIKELELSFAFLRRVAAGSRSVSMKMSSFGRLDIAGLMATELARRIPLGDKSSLARLEALLREPSKAELDPWKALMSEYGSNIDWMRLRGRGLVAGGTGEGKDLAWDFQVFDKIARTRGLAPYLYRPNQTINRGVEKFLVQMKVADKPATQVVAAIEEAKARTRAMDDDSGWYGAFVNPVGRMLVDDSSFADWGAYAARSYGFAGSQRLFRLQVRLRASGITNPDDVAAALAGALGKEHLNPFTGEPMQYVRESNGLRYAVPRGYVSGAIGQRLAGPAGPRAQFDLAL